MRKSKGKSRKNGMRSYAVWLRIVGYGSIGLLGCLGLSLVLPMVPDASYAEEPSTDSVMTSSVNTNMTTLVRSSVAVALSSRVELDVTPKAKGAFSTSVAELKVATNNTTGYAVYMQTTDNSSELKATNPHVETSISPIAGVMSAEDYTANLNTWGYAVTDGSITASKVEYKAVPKAGEEAIVRTTGISREDDYDLSFAVAVGTDLPAGLYTNQLLVSVVANPIEVRSLNDINYMQDMTSEICAITFEGETKQLVDTRDGKSYWVAKLKDGNCWMTQNLGLTAPEGGLTLTPEDSDVQVESILPQTMSSDESDAWAADDDIAQSINFGNNNGTYFSYFAVVVQNDFKSATQNSVCPKGWKLPLAGTKYDTTSGSYYNLLNAYGLATTTKSTAGVYETYLPDGKKITTIVKDGEYTLFAEPLQFTQNNGMMLPTVGFTTVNGNNLWSAVAFGARQAYFLNYSGPGVDTSNNNSWFGLSRFGKPVRCLAR